MLSDLEIKRICPSHIAPQEWRLRVELAACYRVFDYKGWSEEIFNHITVRVPGGRTHYLINPFGLNYSEVTAHNLVKVDLEGQMGTSVSPQTHAVLPYQDERGEHHAFE